MENTARNIYLSSINRVIDAIHANLDAPLTLGELSRVAGFSPFHFHRIFKAFTGETLNGYIQRARLERAAGLLAYGNENVLQVGLACGFTNAAAFTRAFKTHFGESPSHYRSNFRKMSKADRKQGKETNNVVAYNGDYQYPINEERRTPMNVELKDFPGLHLACIRHMQGYSKGVHNPEIGAAFGRVCQWAGARNLFRPETLVIGIAHDDPAITPNDRCRYDACVTIPAEVTQGSGEVFIQDLPAGRYACVLIDIPSSQTEKIGQAVDWLYGEWLPDSGFTGDDHPPLEIYHEVEGKQPGEWIRMEFCLPVRPV